MTDILPTSVFVLSFECRECSGELFACARIEDPRDDLSLRCAKCGWEGKRSFFEGCTICLLNVANQSVEWVVHRTMRRGTPANKYSERP
jgi:hypothetical protein